MTRYEPALTVAQVAKWLNLHPDTVRAKAKAAEIPGWKTAGGRGVWRFDPDAIRAWQQAHANPDPWARPAGSVTRLRRRRPA